MPPDRELSKKEKLKAEEAALAEYAQKIADAKYKQALAERDLANFNLPPTEKELSATREAIASDNLKRVQAEQEVWKGPDIKPPDGKISTEGTFIENRVLASKTLQNATDKLVNEMITQLLPDNIPSDLTFVFYNASDFSGIEMYKSILAQLAIIESEFNKVDTNTQNIITGLARPGHGGGSPPLLVGYAVAGSIRMVADIYSFFKKSTAIKNFDITVEDTMLVSAFNISIKKKNEKWKVFHPGLYPVNIIKSKEVSNFATQLNTLRKLNNITSANLLKLQTQLDQLNQQLAGATTTTAKQDLELKIKSVSTTKEDCDRVQLNFIQLEALLGAPDATSGVGLQAGLIRFERLCQKLESDNVYVIKLSAQASGSTRTVESAFKATTIGFSGGTQISILVFAPDGSIEFSFTSLSYLAYMESEEIVKEINK